MQIKPNQNAKQRTKNRLREHGPQFQVLREMNAQCLGGRPAINVTSKDGWIGWLPLEEIELEK